MGQWHQTTRFIVDSYHYTNIVQKIHFAAHGVIQHHRWISTKSCSHGKRQKRKSLLETCFNTQACEAANSWLGGFESILKCMDHWQFLIGFYIHAILSHKICD